MGDKQSVGVYLDESTIETADEVKRERDRVGRESASRSAVLADAIELGLAAMDILEDEDPYKPIQTQKHAVRQALLDFYRVGDE